MRANFSKQHPVLNRGLAALLGIGVIGSGAVAFKEGNIAEDARMQEVAVRDTQLAREVASNMARDKGVSTYKYDGDWSVVNPEGQTTMPVTAIPTLAQVDRMHAKHAAQQERDFNKFEDMRKVGDKLGDSLLAQRRIKECDAVDPLGSIFKGVAPKNIEALYDAALAHNVDPTKFLEVVYKSSRGSFSPTGDANRKNILAMTDAEIKRYGGNPAALKSSDIEVAANEAAKTYRAKVGSDGFVSAK